MHPENQKTGSHFTYKGPFQDEEEIRKAMSFNDAGDSVCESTGDFCVATITQGFHIYTARVNPQILPAYVVQSGEAPLCFSFCLSGKLGVTWKRGLQSDTSVIQRGTNSFFWSDQAEGNAQYLSCEVGCFVTLMLTPQTFTKYLAQETGKIPKTCQKILDKKSLFTSLAMTPKMYETAIRAFNHPYQGNTARLHLESCGLSLLAEQIHRLTNNELTLKRQLSRADEECIRAAADILIKEMGTPITISSLSRRVGVNESKLKRGFKQIFGSTIIQFLTNQRMVQAKNLLDEGMDVSQTALAVGYNNVSHFILYYKKTFGVTPGVYKRF